MNIVSFENILSGKRLKLIFLNVVNNLSSQLATLFISFLVVRMISIEIWGEYSKVILLITLLSQISSWGNRDFLIREFSRAPGTINSLWRKSIASRSVLLVPACIFVFFTTYDLSIQCYIIFILFLRFVLQSYDSLILYNRNYTLKIILEFSWGILFAVIVIVFRDKLTIAGLLLLTLILDVLKTIVLIIITKIFLKLPFNLFEIAHLKGSFLFFLLSSTGLIVSRIDQVSAALFLDSKEMGKYQVIMSFLLIIQASSNFILQPFLKNIYRLKFTTLKKISLKLFLSGIVIGGIGILLMDFVILYFYHIELDLWLLLLGFLFVLPIFYYTTYIFSLLIVNSVKFIIGMNFTGGVFTFLLSFIMMNLVEKNIYVILFSTAFTQYVLLIVYKLYSTYKFQGAEK